MADAWIVTSGAYSDYTVECVAPDQETAEAIVAAVPDELRAERVPLRTEAPQTRMVLSMTVGVTRSGEEVPDFGQNGLPVREHVSVEYWWDEPPPTKPCRSSASSYAGSGRAEYASLYPMRVHVSGWDHVRVRKRFSELRAQMLAEPEIWWERLKAAYPGGVTG